MKIRSNRVMLAVTSFVCLLPIIFSLIVYKDLPEQVAIHWNSAGNPDNYVSKAMAAFGMPVLLMGINIFTQICLYNDPKRSNVSQVMRMFAAWTSPVLSLILVPVTLYIAMGTKISVPMTANLLTGITVMFCGNYLPKSRQNYTVGIKLPWTLHSSDNWNKTHRMAGHLWVLGGLVLIVGAFLNPENTSCAARLTFLTIAVLVAVPFLYSYVLYKRSGENGQGEE